MEQSNSSVLDVTILPPQIKHATIFKKYDTLKQGESLIIHNDHDPKPLYYQLIAERGNSFTWDYLLNGPRYWEVKITKRNLADIQETVGEIAANDYRKAKIFSKYGIDFCCGGKKQLKEICVEKGLDILQIENEIQNIEDYTNGRELPYNEWSLDFLVDYIVNTHHSYIKKTIPDLIQYAEKVVCVHGNEHPELIKIQQLVYDVINELTNHLKKEEVILFPYIKDLAQNQKAKIQGLGSVQNPINMMEMEHEVVGKYFEQINVLSNHYELPNDACATYTLFYKILKAFEDDLHLHIHLENNILFPKAIQLEKSFTTK
ncbi:MAG: iron-sulfur cluster repair di-iron protein [Bacteroidota bacterium]|nr:iron-sulfur cluster repair di-iron protein [Bacteroidota bacterium]